MVRDDFLEAKCTFVLLGTYTSRYYVREFAKEATERNADINYFSIKSQVIGKVKETLCCKPTYLFIENPEFS